MIPDRYGLQETPRRHYQQRTKWNVRDADATLIVTLANEVLGGTLFTSQYAAQTGKPCLHVFPDIGWRERVTAFCEAHVVRALNVAGPRASSASGIEPFVRDVLSLLLYHAGVMKNVKKKMEKKEDPLTPPPTRRSLWRAARVLRRRGDETSPASTGDSAVL